MKSKKSNSLTHRKVKENFQATIVLLLLAVVLANSIFLYFRLDLTSDKVFSISTVSRDLARGVEETVYIDYFLSPKLKTATDEPQQVLDLLNEYGARSNGKVVVVEEDASDPANINLLDEFGLQAQQIQVVERDQTSLAVVYSGIVISYKDKTKVLPFVLDPQTIEYQISSKLKELISDDSRTVGILSGEEQLSPQSLQGLTQILSDYEVVSLNAGQAIGEHIDALLVFGSRLIDNDTAYFIDQFIMEGKGVLLGIDRARVDIQDPNLRTEAQDTVLSSLAESYGIIVKDQIVQDVLNRLFPNRRGNLRVLAPYPMWVAVSNNYIDASHPITSSFSGLDLYWTSPLEFSAEAEPYITRLIQTSPEAWLTNPEPQAEGEEDQAGDENGLSTGQSYEVTGTFNVLPDQVPIFSPRTEENASQSVVVATYQGPLTSAVESKNIFIPEITVPQTEAEATSQTETEETYNASTENARLVVVGSFSFSYLYNVTQAVYNLDFIASAVDWLSNDEDLLSIRSKTLRNVQLNRIEDVEARALASGIVKWLNTIVVPIVVLTISFIVLFFRKRKTQKGVNHD